MAKKILIICTSANRLGSASDAAETGSWMEEVAAPYYIWKEKGYDITIASLKGGEVPFDEGSLNPPFLTKEAEKFMLDNDAMAKVTTSLKLSDVDASTFDAVFLPGGHGTCYDLPESEELSKQLSAAWAAGKVVSAVCHGPTGLVNVKDANGVPIVKGRKVTGFSDSEEVAVGKDHLVPFMLESKLKELGGAYECAANWSVHAVRDGNLVTGQNPGSSAKTAELVVEALSA